MPQMAPISWLVLFLVFSMAFIMFNILNFYCFFYKSTKNNNNDSSNKMKNISLLNWKW